MASDSWRGFGCFGGSRCLSAQRCELIYLSLSPAVDDDLSSANRLGREEGGVALIWLSACLGWVGKP